VRSVKRLSPCLYALPRLERRVLVLRAGLGRAAPRSRRTVARRLGTSQRRVKRAERRALRRLAKANRRDGCARRNAAGAIGAVAGPSGDGDGVPQLQPLPAAGDVPRLTSTDAARPPRQQQVLGQRDTGTSNDRDLLRSGVESPAVGAVGSGGDGPDVALILLSTLAALFLLASTVALLLRRRSLAPAAHAGEQVSRREPLAPRPWERWRDVKLDSLPPAPWASPRPPAEGTEAGSNGRPASRGLQLAAAGLVSVIMGRLIGRRVGNHRSRRR
jgi:hypothetical protein